MLQISKNSYEYITNVYLASVASTIRRFSSLRLRVTGPASCPAWLTLHWHGSSVYYYYVTWACQSSKDLDGKGIISSPLSYFYWFEGDSLILKFKKMFIIWHQAPQPAPVRCGIF